jgi:MFS family permease
VFSILGDYKGIPWGARFLIYLTFIPGLVIGLIYTDLAYFLPRVQGISSLGLGITIGVMAATLVVASIPLGILADRYGRRKLLVLGNVLASLSLVAFALTSNFELILSVAVLEGLGEAAFAVSGSALLADLAGNEKRTAAFSLQAFVGWIAGALGSLAVSSVILFQNIGLTFGQAHIVLYVIVGLLGLSVTPLIFRIREANYSAPPVAKKGVFPDLGIKTRRVLPRKSAKVLMRFLGYSIPIAVGAGLFVPLMALWFSSAYGVTDAVSGPVLGFSSLLTAVAVFLSPRLARKFGLVKAIVLTQGLSTIFMAMVPTAPSFATAASLYTVRVFLMNLSNPLSQSLLMGLVPPDERGAASGITASLWRLPNALSSTVGAIWIGMGLLALPFYVATVLYLTSITAFWFLFKNAILPEETGKPVESLLPKVAEEIETTI